MGWSGAVWPLSLVPNPKACTLHHSVTGTLVFGAIVLWVRQPGSGSREQIFVSCSGPEPCSRLAWSRTVSLHAPPLCDGCPSIWNHRPGGPGTQLGFPD
jgi:hypothetical protein